MFIDTPLEAPGSQLQGAVQQESFLNESPPPKTDTTLPQSGACSFYSTTYAYCTCM
jgi:hypothetical protein